MTNNKGFTLIELIVVMAISTAMLGLGISNYRGFAQRQEIANAKGQFMSDLRQTQQDALAGRKPSTCTGDLVRLEVRITQSSSPPSYDIRVECTLSGSRVLSQKTLSDNVTLTAVSNSVYFYPLTGETQSNNTITLTLDGQSQTISIGRNGQINP